MVIFNHARAEPLAAKRLCPGALSTFDATRRFGLSQVPLDARGLASRSLGAPAWVPVDAIKSRIRASFPGLGRLSRRPAPRGNPAPPAARPESDPPSAAVYWADAERRPSRWHLKSRFPARFVAAAAPSGQRARACPAPRLFSTGACCCHLRDPQREFVGAARVAVLRPLPVVSPHSANPFQPPPPSSSFPFLPPSFLLVCSVAAVDMSSWCAEGKTSFQAGAHLR